MANTTFNGPVRSEKGFQVATKNTTTGAVTTRYSSQLPDLTGLSLSDVATSSTITLAADTISYVNYTGAGTWASYSDGTPIKIVLDMTFKEIDPVYAEDYDEITKGVGY